MGPGLKSEERLECMLELVIELRTVESIGAEISGAESGMPVQVEITVTVASLIEGLDRLIVRTQSSRETAAAPVGTEIAC